MTFSASRFLTSRLISSAYHSPDLVSPNASFTLVTVNPVPDGVKGEPVDECDVQLESFQPVIGGVFGEPAAELADPATELVLAPKTANGKARKFVTNRSQILVTGKFWKRRNKQLNC